MYRLIASLALITMTYAHAMHGSEIPFKFRFTRQETLPKELIIAKEDTEQAGTTYRIKLLKRGYQEEIETSKYPADQNRPAEEYRSYYSGTYFIEGEPWEIKQRATIDEEKHTFDTAHALYERLAQAESPVAVPAKRKSTKIAAVLAQKKLKIIRQTNKNSIKKE